MSILARPSSSRGQGPFFQIIVSLTKSLVKNSSGLTVLTKSNALQLIAEKKSGPGFSKLTTSLVNVSLKFQMYISQICQYFY